MKNLHPVHNRMGLKWVERFRNGDTKLMLQKVRMEILTAIPLASA